MRMTGFYTLNLYTSKNEMITTGRLKIDAEPHSPKSATINKY